MTNLNNLETIRVAEYDKCFFEGVRKELLQIKLY